MSHVWRRYPNGGGEMLLALALADHAHDDGTHIYPSIKQLSEKTRQSKRTVQYQLRKMEEAGWLVLENSGNGGRNLHRVYHINEAWINGANLASPENGAKQSKKGAIHDTKGATDDVKGATAIAPAYNHQEPSEEPSENHQQPDPENSTSMALATAPVGEVDPIAFSFVLKDGSAYDLPLSQVKQFTTLYPSVDVDMQMRACVGWNITNPTKRKSRADILNHINNWLSTKQSKPQPVQAQYQQPQHYQQTYQSNVFETAKDRARRVLAEKLNGGKNDDPRIIDIN